MIEAEGRALWMVASLVRTPSRSTAPRCGDGEHRREAMSRARTSRTRLHGGLARAASEVSGCLGARLATRPEVLEVF
jgi:hypothetical protein